MKGEGNIVTLGEGMTPLVPLPRIGRRTGFQNLLMKDEGTIPTGTFKARGAAVGVSRAKELGVRELAMPTNGNAGGAWALYCARAGIKCFIVMPEDAPALPRNECALSGAELFLVRGLISDAGKIIGKAVKRHGWYDASTLKEPYRIEGKKTMGFEIVEQLDWQVPDVILYPTGGGVGIIGIYKGLRELQEIGWIGEKMPRLVAVQAAGCAPDREGVGGEEGGIRVLAEFDDHRLRHQCSEGPWRFSGFGGDLQNEWVRRNRRRR